VDGNPGEWSARSPIVENLGLIVRDAQNAGEFVWRDPAADSRTDIASPENVADLWAFQVTGNTSGVYFLARRDPNATFSGDPIQLQIAIDVDRTAGSGQAFFAEYGDASVANANLWEYLVVTRFGSGNQPRVYNTSFSDVSAGQAQAAQDKHVEIFVPWSVLGLSGPPAAPLRFTVATFRSNSQDRTVDISDSPNVLDAVTQYGEPSGTLATPKNTWVEVQDGIVDHAFDLWFDANGEVRAPLVIQRFVPSGTAVGEWFVIRNVTGAPISLDGFKLGDEETPDGTGEGMYSFPAGASVAAGADYIVAYDGAAYQSGLGELPDAELSAASSAPDMVKFMPWVGNATNSLALSNTGDELLVVDPSNTVIDFAAFGNSPLSELTPFTPAPGTGAILSRYADSHDTDNCKSDFANLGAACVSDANCSGACKQCVGNVCVNKPTGAACADSNLCNGSETCDATGTCVAGTPKTCDDANPCTNDSCTPADGLCAHVPGTGACDDGNACTSNDSCSGGACVGGATASCDDTNACTNDSCDPVSGCQHVDNTSQCDDGVFCNGMDTCAAGTCSEHSGDPCTGADGDDNCSESCDEVANTCTGDDPNGSACTDGLFCTLNESCQGGACIGSESPCPGPDGDENCSESCDEASDACTAPDVDGSSCNDGLFCTATDACQSGVCAGSGNPCPGPDSDDDCSETCNEQSDACDANDPDGAGCLNGTCSSGVCEGAAGSAGAGGSAGAAGTAGSAGTAGTAGSAGTAGTAGTAGSAGTAGTAGTAGSAGSAGSSAHGGSSGSAGQGTGGSTPVDPTIPEDEGGCGCAVPGSSSSTHGLLFAALGIVLSRLRRRAR